MILNLGCGNVARTEGITNVDIRQLPTVDVVADVKKLPFKDGEVDGIINRNLIEHFGGHETKELLQEWARVLKPGGWIQTETVDGGETMNHWQEIPEENLLDGILGAQTYPENFHKMIFTRDSLVRHLEEARLHIHTVNQFVDREIPRILIEAIKK